MLRDAGPPPVWLLGNLLDVLRMSFPKAAQHWRKKYGPVFKVLAVPPLNEATRGGSRIDRSASLCAQGSCSAVRSGPDIRSWSGWVIAPCPPRHQLINHAALLRAGLPGRGAVGRRGGPGASTVSHFLCCCSIRTQARFLTTCPYTWPHCLTREEASQPSDATAAYTSNGQSMRSACLPVRA